MAAAVASPTPLVLGGSLKDHLPEGLGQNGGRISTDHIGLLRPTPASLPMEEMRQRLEQDGYLFVKGLIPREDVLDEREK
jgi:phytanoyl-CoA hydroxylase